MLGLHHVQLAALVGSGNKAREFFGTICGMNEIPKPKNQKNMSL
jgi:hypothetical protein